MADNRLVFMQWPDDVSGYLIVDCIHKKHYLVLLSCSSNLFLVACSVGFFLFYCILSETFCLLYCTCVIVVCSIFPVIVSLMFIFPLSAQFPKILYALPHQSDVYPASVLEGSVNHVWFSKWERKKALVRCHALPWVQQSLFVYRSVPQQYPTLSTHTLSCAQSSLRKQATAITRARTGAALCRKTCAHFPGSWLTHHCPIILYSTWKSPKSQEKNTWHFLAPLYKTTLWILKVCSWENKRKMQLWCLE